MNTLYKLDKCGEYVVADSDLEFQSLPLSSDEVRAIALGEVDMDDFHIEHECDSSVLSPTDMDWLKLHYS